MRAWACVLAVLCLAAACQGSEEEETVVTRFGPLPLMSREELATYDGTDEDKPLLLGIKGYIFDVTSGARFYGKDGPYHVLVAKDASRVTAIWSMAEEDQNDNVSDLTEQQLNGLREIFESTYVPKYKAVAVLRGTPFWDEILEEAKRSDEAEADNEL